MRLPGSSLAAVVLTAPLLVAGQLDYYAKKAGLQYFGAATDTPGQRERAPFPATYATYSAILTNPREFGQTTPTNGMKWLFTEPEAGVFNYTEGEVVAGLAAATGKTLRCHALVWHNQLAPWVENTTWTPDTLRAAITRHVANVASHWKGRCHAWDVVNEALDEDGTYRKSLFYNVLGEEYIKLAFQAAAKADPGAKLYYNDYGIERPGSVKTAGALRLVKMLRDAGVRIDGVGMQAHLHADVHPTAQDHVDTMNAFTALGVAEVAFTELDVRIEMPVNATNLAWQADSYRAVATACVRVPKCVGITLWDFYDPFSWVPDTFPGQGAALLWFDNFTVHPAYDVLIDTFKGLAKANLTAPSHLKGSLCRVDGIK
ncbi:glycoside hydrolase superfamily [Lasiosphaeria miniovina]|uniref:Beta-xylanase n=1 Tax=Lasiosphaeria miniovina TaxID=1954250 RepID=A0AA40E6U2_9PEZI|nr:glycoside hydrolase superfamily [Lasiosphaeria miniovina]KAK0727162.1 glycoside hydrolase superfamily [Lasiosphaeria miniovina]